MAISAHSGLDDVLRKLGSDMKIPGSKPHF